MGDTVRDPDLVGVLVPLRVCVAVWVGLRDILGVVLGVGVWLGGSPQI